MQVIGAGLGRTGTYSLKAALNQLGLGPCHHMEGVRQNMSVQVPLWDAAVAGHANWAAVYDGFGSAVDWPTASFFRELMIAYPDAKFVLTTRSPESWAESFSETIYKVLGGRENAPPAMRDWLSMVVKVLEKAGIPSGLDRAGLIKAFVAHNDAVKASIPKSRLLEFDVKQGWAPLCAFLDMPVPGGDFPRTNDREEFFKLVSGQP